MPLSRQHEVFYCSSAFVLVCTPTDPMRHRIDALLVALAVLCLPTALLQGQNRARQAVTEPVPRLPDGFARFEANLANRFRWGRSKANSKLATLSWMGPSPVSC